eukprot:4151370-Pleurochrysis_carterae.AAC.6
MPAPGAPSFAAHTHRKRDASRPAKAQGRAQHRNVDLAVLMRRNGAEVTDSRQQLRRRRSLGVDLVRGECDDETLGPLEGAVRRLFLLHALDTQHADAIRADPTRRRCAARRTRAACTVRAVCTIYTVRAVCAFRAMLAALGERAALRKVVQPDVQKVLVFRVRVLALFQRRANVAAREPEHAKYRRQAAETLLRELKNQNSAPARQVSMHMLAWQSHPPGSGEASM